MLVSFPVRILPKYRAFPHTFKLSCGIKPLITIELIKARVLSFTLSVACSHTRNQYRGTRLGVPLYITVVECHTSSRHSCALSFSLFRSFSLFLSLSLCSGHLSLSRRLSLSARAPSRATRFSSSLLSCAPAGAKTKNEYSNHWRKTLY